MEHDISSSASSSGNFPLMGFGIGHPDVASCFEITLEVGFAEQTTA